MSTVEIAVPSSATEHCIGLLQLERTVFAHTTWRALVLQCAAGSRHSGAPVRRLAFDRPTVWISNTAAAEEFR